ncbi:MAG: hypothetical protein GY930_12535 [bacterium]|nr:hypothetical protein [bacterium]
MGASRLAAQQTLSRVADPAVVKNRVEAQKSALVTLTGRESDVVKPTYKLIRNQEDFDKVWLAHKGSRVNRAAQGWPMIPQLDFKRVQALMLFGGDREQCNGYRIVEILEEADVVTVRIDLITYQTTSTGFGEDENFDNSVQPWALMVLPATGKSIIVEENTQSMKNHPAKWTRRAGFQGFKGIGRYILDTPQVQTSE